MTPHQYERFPGTLKIPSIPYPRSTLCERFLFGTGGVISDGIVEFNDVTRRTVLLKVDPYPNVQHESQSSPDYL